MDKNKFVSEGKVDEEIKRRQAEWERVRKPSDPVEAPAEVFDNRTLFDRLKEQNDIKKKQFEEQFSLKNQIRGIDTEEADFLYQVDRNKELHEKRLKEEEKRELSDYKEALKKDSKLSAQLPKKIVCNTIKEEKKLTTLLSKAIVSKRKLNDGKIPIDQQSKHLKPIIAILPGLGVYNSDSSNSSDSSSSDEETIRVDIKNASHKDSHANAFLSH